MEALRRGPSVGHGAPGELMKTLHHRAADRNQVRARGRPARAPRRGPARVVHRPRLVRLLQHLLLRAEVLLPGHRGAALPGLRRRRRRTRRSSNKAIEHSEEADRAVPDGQAGRRRVSPVGPARCSATTIRGSRSRCSRSSPPSPSQELRSTPSAEFYPRRRLSPVAKAQGRAHGVRPAPRRRAEARPRRLRPPRAQPRADVARASGGGGRGGEAW